MAISIPIFTSQLEKSREATDAANFRAAYAEASADMLTNDASTYTKHIDAVQTQDGWQNTSIEKIGEYKLGSGAGEVPAVKKATNKGWTVAVDLTNNKVTITADN